MDPDYIPYGPEWEKEMMKLPKKMLIDMFKKTRIRLYVAEKIIESSPSFTGLTVSQRDEVAEWIASKT